MESQRDEITLFLNMEILQTELTVPQTPVENRTFNLMGSPGTSIMLTSLSGEEDEKRFLRKLL